MASKDIGAALIQGNIDLEEQTAAGQSGVLANDGASGKIKEKARIAFSTEAGRIVQVDDKMLVEFKGIPGPEEGKKINVTIVNRLNISLISAPEKSPFVPAK